MATRRLDRQFVDFAAATRFPSWYGWGVVLVGAVLAGDAAYSYLRAQQELAELGRTRTQPSASQRTAGRDSAAAAVDARRLKQEWTEAERLARRLAAPWDQLFGAIERSAGAEVVLLSVRPEAQRNQLAIQGETKDLLAALNYVLRLEAEPALVKPHLVSHEYKTEPSSLPLVFTAIAGWRVAP